MKYYAIIFLVVALLGCSRQKEQLEKVVFDARQINSQIFYTHSFYPSGKIKTTKKVGYYYKNGSLIDSLISIKEFFYNRKGQIIRVAEDDINEYRLYNNVDSLVVEYSINEFGDTVYLQKYRYDNGEIASNTYRHLTVKLNEENIALTDFREYDTTFSQTDYARMNDTLNISFERNIKNEIIYRY